MVSGTTSRVKAADVGLDLGQSPVPRELVSAPGSQDGNDRPLQNIPPQNFEFNLRQSTRALLRNLNKQLSQHDSFSTSKRRLGDNRARRDRAVSL
jgi:hypothetical protein